MSPNQHLYMTKHKNRFLRHSQPKIYPQAQPISVYIGQQNSKKYYIYKLGQKSIETLHR